MTRVLITGDRHCHCTALALRVVQSLLQRYGPDILIVHGDAPGVDRSFQEACEALEVRSEAHPADWGGGKGAGPRRNAKMVAAGAAFCIAVHGDLFYSKGTRDCVRRAIAAGIPTWHIDPDRGDETPRRLKEAP